MQTEQKQTNKTYYVSNAKEWLVKTEETPLEYNGIKMQFPTKDMAIIKCVKPD